MSFDFKLDNGDIKVANRGDLTQVRNDEKLRQDLLKIILTPLGSNKTYLWYGSPLNSALIGRLLESSLISAEASRAVTFAINNLIRLQKDQERSGQFLTPSEAISQILDISIERSAFDGRQFNIVVSVGTRRSNVVTETFALTL